MPAPSAEARRIRGEYFTPPPLVEAVLALAPRHAAPGPLTIVDPGVRGRGFPLGSRPCAPRPGSTDWSSTRRTPPPPVAPCRGARILVGDALRGGWDALVRTLPADGSELWLGNPPYNGTSPLLRDPSAYLALRPVWGSTRTSLAGPASATTTRSSSSSPPSACRRAPGVLAWVTSATLLDAFLYASLRRRLLDRLVLREVVDLGGGVFPGTRVRTCVTVWRSRRGPAPSPRFRAWAPGRVPFEGAPSRPFSPGGPEWSLRPVPARSRAPGRAVAGERRAARRAGPGQLHRTEDPLRRAAGGRASGPAPRAGATRSSLPGPRAIRTGPRHSRRRSSPSSRRCAATTGAPVPRRPGGHPALPPLGRGTAPRRAAGERTRLLLPRPPAHPAGRPPAGRRVRPARRRLQAGVQRARAAARGHASSRLRDASPRIGTRASRRSSCPSASGARGRGRDVPARPSVRRVPNLSDRGLAWAERVGGPREAFRRIAAFLNSRRSRTSGRRRSGAAGCSRFRCPTDEAPAGDGCSTH